jgi:hypothetical protein
MQQHLNSNKISVGDPATAKRNLYQFPLSEAMPCEISRPFAKVLGISIGNSALYFPQSNGFKAAITVITCSCGKRILYIAVL